jgi:hypothetical protein
MKCTTCSTVFDNKDKSSYVTHVRQCSPTGTFVIGDQKITVERNNQGLFLCYCSHPSCSTKGFTTINGLKAHMKKAMSTWVGPEGKATKVISFIHSQKYACWHGMASQVHQRAKTLSKHISDMSPIHYPTAHFQFTVSSTTRGLIQCRSDDGVTGTWTCNGKSEYKS